LVSDQATSKKNQATAKEILLNAEKVEDSRYCRRLMSK